MVNCYGNLEIAVDVDVKNILVGISVYIRKEHLILHSFSTFWFCLG